MTEEMWIQLGRVVLIIGLASVFAKVFSVSMGVWQKRRAPKPRGKVVVKPFNYMDVNEGMGELVRFAREFGPDLIIGINRGGAIIGGMLGKHLDRMVHLLEVAPGNGRVRFFGDRAALSGRRVILVDDRAASGRHMELAYEDLRSIAQEVRTAVFARVTGPEGSPHAQHFAPHAHGYMVSSDTIPLPWEPGEARSWG